MRVSVSIENKADCPTLNRIFDVGRIIAFGEGRKGSEGIRCARSFDHGRDEVLRREHVAAAASRIPEQEPAERSFMNSWDDRNFVAAINKKADARKILIAGLWTEKCVAPPTIQALHGGFEVNVVEDY